MIVLVYSSEILISRMKPLFDASEVKMVAVTQKITEQKDLGSLENLSDVDLANFSPIVQERFTNFASFGTEF